MKKKTKINKKFIRNILLILVACLIINAFYGVLAQINDYNDKIAVLNKQLEEETRINNALKEEKLNVHSDENYKEIARKTLGLVEPGDKVYINSKD